MAKEPQLQLDNTASVTSQRRYDVDWLRTVALGLLIIYHIVISFQPWAKAIGFIQNDESLEWLWIPMSALNVWRIPLLFMVSGMGARFAMERRDWKQFLSDRAMRILLPLVFGIFFICPIADYLVKNYYGLEAGYTPNAGHLWFLINIFLYVIYFLSTMWALTAYPENPFLRFISRSLRRPWVIFAAAIPLMLEASLVDPEYYASFPTPHGHFVGMICFIMGFTFVCLKDDFWRAVQKVKLSALGFAFSLFLVRLLVFEIVNVPKFLVAFESMCWMLAVLGYGSAYLNKPSGVLTYFSKAVYPAYIIHFPIQYAITYYLIPLSLPAILKLGILLIGTFGACLLIYEFILRRMKWIRPLFGMKLNRHFTAPPGSLNSVRYVEQKAGNSIIKREVSKAALNKEPYLVWNAFVNLLAMEDEGDLTDMQKAAQRAFWYDSEVQNGGHMQYFENQRRDDYSSVVESLKQLGAIEQASALEKAIIQLRSKKRSPIEDEVSYVKKALEGEFDQFDTEYYDVQPELIDLLQKHLDENLDDYIVFRD